MDSFMTSHIVFSEGYGKGVEELKAYEASMLRLSLSEKLGECQSLCDSSGEIDIAKVFLLFLIGGDEVNHEVKRIFSWEHQRSKLSFLTAQMSSKNSTVVCGAIDLLGILGDPTAISFLESRFDLGDVEIAKHIVAALSKIAHPLGMRAVLLALKSSDKSLLMDALGHLSRRVDIIPWKAFRNLLKHEAGDVRAKAAFAISLRKAPQSGARLFRTLAREKNPIYRRQIIGCLGNVPSKKFIWPLLSIIATDSDHKARLIASRALDRLQGMLSADVLYKFRDSSNLAVRYDVLFRLGKFGSQVVKHKEYIRYTLIHSTDSHAMQACILALGHIAERQDIDLLRSYLFQDPLIAYSAAIALTKILRLEDASLVLEILKGKLSPVVRQIFLRYLARRRALGLAPGAILEVVMLSIEARSDINTCYVAFCLLEHAPSKKTIELLLSSMGDGPYEREAINRTLNKIIANNGDVALSFLADCNINMWRGMLRSLPQSLEPQWYHSLASIFFNRCQNWSDEEGFSVLLNLIEFFLPLRMAIKEFLRVAPDDIWKAFILRVLIEHADRNLILDIKEELLSALKGKDSEVRSLAMLLIISLKDANIVPYLISAAESDPKGELRKVAQHIARALIEKGVL